MKLAAKAARAVPFWPGGLLLGRAWFDDWAYLYEYPDVAAACVDPWRHFLTRGYKEGRRPSPLFDRLYYLGANPDVAAAGLEPWRHFLLHGLREGRNPSQAFNIDWYRRRFPEVGASDPWVHHRRNPQYSPVPLFDPDRYRREHMDAFVQDVDPWIHYIVSDDNDNAPAPAPLFLASWYSSTYLTGHIEDKAALLHFIGSGWAAGHQPSAAIDPKWYSAHVRSEADSHLPAETHYQMHGVTADASPSALFDPVWYRRVHSVPAGIAPVEHFHTEGYARQLPTAETFDVRFYIQHNRDLREHDPWLHYEHVGRFEARAGSAGQVDRWRVLVSDVRRRPIELSLALHGADGTKRLVRTAEEALCALLGIEFATVDVWDTLITRPWPADSAKHHVARVMLPLLADAGWYGTAEELVALRGASEYALACRTLSADGNPASEYTAHEVWLHMLVPLVGDESVALADEAIRSEIAWEVAVAQLLPGGAFILDLLQQSGIRTVLISDYYLPAQDLRGILTSAGVAIDGLPLLVSSDEGASKRSGGLLKRVRDAYGVPAAAHIHVGDSLGSDVAPQIATGGRALRFVSRAPWRPSPGQLSEEVLFNSIAGRYDLGTPAPNTAADDVPKQWSRLCGSELQRYARLAAHPFGAIPAVLVTDALKAAQESGMNKICYLSREGALFKRVHEAMPPDIRGDVRAVHLRVSRMSLFLASMVDFSFEQFQRLFRMYPLVSPKILAESLTLDDAESLALRLSVLQHGVSWSEPFDWNANTDAALAMFSGPNVQESLHAAKVSRRAAFDAYLRSQNLADAERFLAVDLGWRGTIQDMLSLATGKPTIGQYLVLLGFLNPQLPGSVKRASLLDANAGDDVSWLDPHVSAVERLCTGPIPTTTGYTAQGKAVLKDDLTFAVGGAEPVLRAVHDALVLAATEYATLANSAAFGSEALRQAALTATRTLVEAPPAPLVIPLGAQSHDETFGEGNTQVVGRLQRAWPAAAEIMTRFVQL